METYIVAESPGFAIAPPARYRAGLVAAVFVDVEVRDRNDWYQRQAVREMESLDGPRRSRVVELVGADNINHAIDIWRKMLVVLESGEHRPGHFLGR